MKKLSAKQLAKWMRTPNPKFGGATPAEVKRGGGAKRVEYELQQLESGMEQIANKILGPAMEKLRASLWKDKLAAAIHRVLNEHRKLGTARFRILTTIAAEGVSRQLAGATRNKAKPEAVALTKGLKHLERAQKWLQESADKRCPTVRNKRKYGA